MWNRIKYQNSYQSTFYLRADNKNKALKKMNTAFSNRKLPDSDWFRMIRDFCFYMMGFLIRTHYLGPRSIQKQYFGSILLNVLPLPRYHTAPAHPHATDAAVYTALFHPALQKKFFTVSDFTSSQDADIICMASRMFGLKLLVVFDASKWANIFLIRRVRYLRFKSRMIPESQGCVWEVVFLGRKWIFKFVNGNGVGFGWEGQLSMSKTHWRFSSRNFLSRDLSQSRKIKLVIQAFLLFR